MTETPWTPPPAHTVPTPDGRQVGYCLYGEPGGVPVIFHSGSPSTRWKRPDVVRATEQSGVRLLVADRPGYGDSTRQPGRTVADVVGDVRLLADAQGWDRFAVAGGSGGGPHALACAALLPDRVTRCAVSGSIAPPLVDGPAPGEDEPDPRRNLTSWLAARGEHRLRPEIEAAARQIMALVDAGGPEFPPDPEAPEVVAPPARDSAASMARLRATFVDSHDGWVDDNLAFARDWGFALDAIDGPVSLWFGSKDLRSRRQADHLAAAIPGATRHEYAGGHVQNEAAYRRMLGWLVNA
ncbi:alpha/beta hydrolase fold protein [Kribbella flavida DSM 17836]|uniref:Alpha/beta hydrolase fold protein n=1 Tax=Kribbella flavida (strain DSM 17836 / JCM 10339 / NBRC 14399) TaxID=479435 RepID=D2Q3R7_KRIFD|nr:alpha/beta hydrolase [Kribbella flavida]ADB35939.1 alpha/beta hydrolase fold protein [Kribbella flavida DSM 17836]